MKILADSVGKVPIYAVYLTLGIGFLINIVFFIKINIHGPSAVVSGLSQPATLMLHQADERYAVAIAERFCHEYFNWTWNSQFKAKARAAYLSNTETAEIILKGSRLKTHYYNQLLASSNAEPKNGAVVEHDKVSGRFIVELTFTVREWQSFLPSQHDIKAQIVLDQQENLSERPFLLQVSNYTFDPLSDPVALPISSRNDIDMQLWNYLAAKGHSDDRLYYLKATKIKGTIIDDQFYEYRVLSDEEWKISLAEDRKLTQFNPVIKELPTNPEDNTTESTDPSIPKENL
jgi:hypothetical protein